MEPIGEKELEQVRGFITQVRERFGIPGISVAISAHGVCIEAAVGVSNVESGRSLSPDDYFELGCLNKFLTGLCVLDLVVEGRVDLHAPIATYLPEVAGTCGDQVTVEQLLSHTGGYQGDNMLDPEVLQDLAYADFARTFADRPLQFVPGTTFDYSHAGGVLLGQAVARQSGMNPADYARTRLFSRLGIATLDEEGSPSESVVGAHVMDPQTRTPQLLPNLALSPLWRHSLTGTLLRMGDLAQLGAALMGHPKVLSSQLSALLFHPMVELPAVAAANRAEERFYHFERGCARYPTGVRGVRSTSVGSTCSLRMDPSRGVAIAIAINSPASHLRDFVASKLYNALLPQDLLPISELSSPDADRFELEEVEGTYHGASHHTLTARCEDGHLAIRMGHNPAVTVDTRAVIARMVRNDLGFLVPAAGAAGLEMGFFRERGRGNPALMVGVNAYRQSGTMHK